MILNVEQLRELCEVAKTAAIEAGEYIKSSIDTTYSKLENKKSMSQAAEIVTVIDLKSEEIILKYLEPTCVTYDLGLLTEERKDDLSRLSKDYFWAIDPLDGTLPYSKGDTGYAVSIALVSKNGESILGVVVIPDKEEVFTSIKGEGVFMNNRPFYPTNKLDDGSLKVFSDHSLKKERDYDKTLMKLNKASMNLGNDRGFEIHFGFGAVVNAISVMNNSCACYFKPPKSNIGGGSIWDFAATNLFFRELGFISSEFAGNEMNLNEQDSLFMNHCGVLYANSKELASEILKIGSLIEQ